MSEEERKNKKLMPKKAIRKDAKVVPDHGKGCRWGWGRVDAGAAKVVTRGIGQWGRKKPKRNKTTCFFNPKKRHKMSNRWPNREKNARGSNKQTEKQSLGTRKRCTTRRK